VKTLVRRALLVLFRSVMATSPPPAPAARELAELRRRLDVGLERGDGRLDLLLLRLDQADQAAADHEARLDALERARWPLPSLLAVVAFATMLITFWQVVGG
jgi:hypothetical protein